MTKFPANPSSHPGDWDYLGGAPVVRLTVGEQAKRVGAWETPEGFVSFGSWQAVAAFCHHVQNEIAQRDEQVISAYRRFVAEILAGDTTATPAKVATPPARARSVNTLQRLLGGFVELWCQATHGGGHIERDPSGRVNWQCNRCGRWAQPVPEGDEANLLKQHMKWLLEKPDCAGGSPCSTCPDKRQCDHGCIRIPDFISTEFHHREWSALQRIRAAIAADRCDGSTEYAAGVNAACAQHLLFIDTLAPPTTATPANGSPIDPARAEE